MMKKFFNVFSRSRRVNLSEILSPGDAGYPRNALCGCSQISKAGYSVVTKDYSAAGSVSDRIYAPYSIYKGKAALSLSPNLPTFKKLDSGSGLKVDRRGSMMLKFWPAVGERKYDWEKRQLFALSPTEMGAIISLGPKESCEFFHDPSMKSSNAGQVRKSLSIKPTQDGTGYFISLSVVNNILKSTDRFTVPVTSAEFAVMKTACSFALPQVMGWNRSSSSPQQRKMEQKPSKVDPQLLDLEWDK